MRRVRRPGVAVPTTVQVVRERRPPRRLLQEGQVSVTLLITAELVRGEVSEKDLAEWVAQAVHSYHRFRNGWVGIGAVGGINVPSVVVADDDQT